MRIKKRFLQLGLCLLMLFSAAPFHELKSEPAPNKKMFEPSNSPLATTRRLAIVATLNQHAPNGAIILKWSLKNVSRKEIKFRDTNIFLDYKICVKNRNNDQVRLTEKGQQATTASYFASHKTSLTLQPGEEITKQIEITDFFDMKTKGVYFVVLERNLPTDGGKAIEVIRSNIIRIRVGS